MSKPRSSRRGEKRKPSKRNIIAAMLCFLLIGTTLSVIAVWGRIQVLHHAYRLSAAERKHKRLTELNRRLQVQLALLKNPKRLARVAESELGLRPPEPEQIHRLRKPKPELPTLPRTTTLAKRSGMLRQDPNRSFE